MHGDHQRDVKEQFPIVMDIRSVLRDIDLLGEVFDLNEIILSRLVEGIEKVLVEPILACSVQHAGQRVSVQLSDQFTSERMEKVLEGVRKLRIPMVARPGWSCRRYQLQLVVANLILDVC